VHQLAGDLACACASSDIDISILKIFPAAGKKPGGTKSPIANHFLLRAIIVYSAAGIFNKCLQAFAFELRV
jgi:hypothetical protein